MLSFLWVKKKKALFLRINFIKFAREKYSRPNGEFRIW